MNLIDKDKVAAEIEKRKSELQSRITELGTFESNTLGLFQDVDLYDDILSFIDTLKVKEVDLEKELEKLDRILYDLDGVAIAGATHYLTVEDVKDIAKRFYEMGLNARKEE